MSDYQHHRLRTFVARLATLLDSQPDEATILRQGSGWLAELIRHDDWLDEAFTQPHPAALSAISAVCRCAAALFRGEFCLGPGQQTPIHDHRVWGLIGAARRRDFTIVAAGPARFTG